MRNVVWLASLALGLTGCGGEPKPAQAPQPTKVDYVIKDGRLSINGKDAGPVKTEGLNQIEEKDGQLYVNGEKRELK
jgi:hypothetical protein